MKQHVAISGARVKEGMTQRELAKQLASRLAGQPLGHGTRATDHRQGEGEADREDF